MGIVRGGRLDLPGDPRGPGHLLLEVRSRSVQLGGIVVLVVRAVFTSHLLMCIELVPVSQTAAE